MQVSNIDAVLLVLHGAMASETNFDPEGTLLDAVRECVGAIPIVASLDFHAVITDRMLNTADMMVGYHTYPHTDFYETGVRAARKLGAHVEGKCNTDDGSRQNTADGTGR